MQSFDLKARIDERDRRIYQTPIGDLFSVTTILSATKDEKAKRAIADWIEKEREEGRDHRAGAKRGSAVHELVERYLLGDTDPQSEDIEITSYFYSLMGILDSIKRPFLIESAIYHPIGYAGRIDCLAMNSEDEVVLYDWKTSKRYIPKKYARIWKEDYLLQVSAYAQALHHLYGKSLRIDRAVVAIAYPYSISNFALEIKMDQSDLEQYFLKFCKRLENFRAISYNKNHL